MNRKWFVRLVFLVGLLLLLCPIIISVVQQRRQNDAVATYEGAVSNRTDQEVQQMLSQAEEYNNLLFQSNGAVVDNLDSSILSDDSYNSILDLSLNGVMASIEIPKIDVDLPIYHGTSDAVLDMGIGHIQGTSLPIGGSNTHCVLSGHRGLPGSKLFTRLDEMKKGDYFFISVLGKTLAYKVYDIQVVEPDNTEVLQIVADKDIVSLVTCTPYGLNTHRLVVTGERVPYEEADYNNIEAGIPSLREILFTATPFVLLAVACGLKIKDWRKAKHEKKD